MTVAELVDMVRVLAQPPEALTDGAIIQMLNVAQDDVGRALRAPIQTVDYANITSPGGFHWPTDAREEGILEVYALTTDEDGTVRASTRIPIYDFNTASTYDPAWTLQSPAEVAKYVVWDATYLLGYPLLVPPPSEDHPQAVRVTYVVKPEKMTHLSDKPFSGRLDSFHDVLAYRAAYLLTRDGVMRAEFNRRIGEAKGASNHGAGQIVNPLYRRTVISHGRG